MILGDANNWSQYFSIELLIHLKFEILTMVNLFLWKLAILLNSIDFRRKLDLNLKKIIIPKSEKKPLKERNYYFIFKWSVPWKTIWHAVAILSNIKWPNSMEKKHKPFEHFKLFEYGNNVEKKVFLQLNSTVIPIET